MKLLSEIKAEDRVIEAVREWAESNKNKTLGFDMDDIRAIDYIDGYNAALSDLTSFLDEGLSK